MLCSLHTANLTSCRVHLVPDYSLIVELTLAFSTVPLVFWPPISRATGAPLTKPPNLPCPAMSCSPLAAGVSGGGDIQAVHPQQPLPRQEGLWGPHPLDRVRAGNSTQLLSSPLHSADSLCTMLHTARQGTSLSLEKSVLKTRHINYIMEKGV